MNEVAEPDELLTVVCCPGCEQHSLAGDVVLAGAPDDGTVDQLACPRCGTRVGAAHFHDYASLEVADYE